jgi:hypothetical protein
MQNMRFALHSMLVALLSDFPPGRRRRSLWAGGRIRSSLAQTD